MPNIEFLAVTGRDAGDFLQRQTTQDLSTLAPGRATLAGWLDARGRVRAVFRVLRTPERWILALTDQTAAALARDLTVYVLRSNVKLAPISDWIALARIGPADDWRAVCASAPDHDEAQIVEITAELHHLYGSRTRVEAIGGIADDDPQAALRAEIAAGVPSIAPAIAQQFTAHMLNLDTLGAIAFAKGCYPGQEVTARTHNLGTAKRRARPFRAPTRTLPAAGEEIVDAAGAAVGRVVRAASGADHVTLLAVVELERLATPLYLSTDGKPRLEPITTP